VYTAITLGRDNEGRERRTAMTDPTRIQNLPASKRPQESETAEEAETATGGMLAMFGRGLVPKLLEEECAGAEWCATGEEEIGIDYSGAEPEE
jgi:hypothetical protein